MMLLAIYLFAGIFSQTLYPDREFFKLTVGEDGRVEALISANDPKWGTVYRQFLEMNRDTGELMIAFDVSASEFPSVLALKTGSHIMMSTIGSDEMSWNPSTNVTNNKEGYIHSNMVLWYDSHLKDMVMIYQSSSYWYYSTSDEIALRNTWASNTDLDAWNQVLMLTRMSTDGATIEENSWTEPVQILSKLENPHVHFQFIESLDTSSEGYANQVLVPIHHLSESDIDSNYQWIARTDRILDPNGDWKITRMEETDGAGQGMLQASIIRVPSVGESDQLVAFLRDANGYWIRRSISNDDGYTWSDPIETTLPNPDQMSQAIFLHSGLVMLIYNPSQSMATEPSNGDRYVNCHHLAVGLSADYGLTWQYSRMLEYAYDGMFNYPVGMQDPTCDNIYLTYSVETDLTEGCSLLKECTEESQHTMAYVKFTILTEQWVINDFQYSYDTSENCMWKLSNSLRKTTLKPQDVDASTFNTHPTYISSKDSDIIINLAAILCVLGIGNVVWCYCICQKRNLSYADLEENNISMKEYETTE